MEVNRSLKKTWDLLKKYRYVVLVFAIGFVLMIWPASEKDNTTVQSVPQVAAEKDPTLEDKLSVILSKVAGAGDVQVILTVAAGEETIYQTNNDVSHNENSSSSNYDTVTITDTQRCENGLIRQVIPAIYQGAIVVCQGADDPNIRLEIVEAVSKATGLGANRISVLKMK